LDYDINLEIVRRKTAIVLVGILVVALAVAAYYIRKDKQVVVVDPWVAVPSDAFLIIETPDFPEILTRVTDPAGLFARLSGMKWVASVIDDAATIDSLTGSREVREMISNKKVLLSFHTTSQNHASLLAIMNIGASFTPRRLNQLLRQSGAAVTETKELGGARVFNVSYGGGSKTTSVTLALTSGILIVSLSGTLVENALNNKSTGSDIRYQQGFTQVVNASGKESDNLYILFRNLSGFIRSFVTEEKITPVTSVAIAGGGDLTFKEDGVFISGFLSTAGAGQGADKISEVIPAACGVHELLPQGTLSYKTLMKRAELTGETASDPSSINATDLALAVSPYTGTEVTEALVMTDNKPEKVLLFRMTDRQTAETVIRERLSAKYRSMGLSDSHFLVTAGDAKSEVVMYKMPFTGVASVLSGKSSVAEDDGWVLFAGSYMVFSSSPDALALIRSESDKDNTLINDPEFREMEKTLPTKSSFLFYSSGQALKSVFGWFLTPKASGTLQGKSFSDIEGVGLSLTPSNGMIYTSLSIRYSDNNQQLPQVPVRSTDEGTGYGLNAAWKVKLDAEPAVKTFFFTNHNTGATEIFIQDQKNNIYLISASGKILWKASIRERITGDIYMIDYYKNGKNQLLFSGRDYLHLIDRNGNYVDKFPVKMRSPASNTLAVFDYESNKEYRLFIAGEDRKIYVYDRSGAPVRGWNLFTTRGKVTEPVRFFRVRGKDYLFVSDDQSVYVLDRTGNIRVNPQEPLRKAAGSSVRVTEGEGQKLLFTSPDGTLIRLSFDGTVNKQTISTFSDEHRADFADIDGDNRTDYVFIDHGMLRIYDSSGSEMCSTSFDSDSLTGPFIFSFNSSDRRIAVYETDSKLLYLTGRSCDPAPGFPIKAGPYFNIGRIANKSTWNLITNENDGYLYNYELNSGLK
jgi:hypothetical protein